MHPKQLLVGTPLGRAVMAARDTLHLLRCPAEQRGTLRNDHLAAKLVTRLCRPGMTFIDVGAHIGSVMAEVRGCKIIAFEAMPEKAEALRRKFPTATVHACAVGESHGDVTFFVDRAQSGYSSLSAHRSDTEKIIVPLRTLDSLVSGDDVDVVKIDVEGAELGVLRGALELVRRCRPVILFESAPDEPMYTKAEMWCWLRAHGYLVLVPERIAHDGPGLDCAGFAESHWYPRRTTNYFAVPVERRVEVRDRARAVL
jgi:FkbM family methyltransferase